MFQFSFICLSLFSDAILEQLQQKNEVYLARSSQRPQYQRAGVGLLVSSSWKGDVGQMGSSNLSFDQEPPLECVINTLALTHS